ncbi:MAG: HNH endonuclease [Gammaproteobacteria bacterium]|nr:HNH endonuclease [Gammaproteobacteria bacterium]
MDKPASNRSTWTRPQLLVAYSLYCQLPFGKLHSNNPEIVHYAKLIGRKPSALAMKLANIASLDPEIISTGRKGLKGASAADKSMWHEMQSDWESFFVEANQAVEALDIRIQPNQKFDGDTITGEFTSYRETDKFIQTKARIGQEFFRKAVLSAYSYRCCITDLAVPKLLVASHIIPWRDDRKNRLNPSNGLSLSMLHDKAFDIGMITISKEMTVRVSKKHFVKNDDFYRSALLIYDGKPISLPEKFGPNPDFLKHHRQHIFEH